jgi:hypothetical protein
MAQKKSTPKRDQEKKVKVTYIKDVGNYIKEGDIEMVTPEIAKILKDKKFAK